MELITFNPINVRHKRALVVGGGVSLEGIDVSPIAHFDGAVITVNHVINHLPRADYWVTLDPLSPSEGVMPELYEQRAGTKYFCAIPKTWANHGLFLPLRNQVQFLERVIYGNQPLLTDKRQILFADSGFMAFQLAVHMGAKQIIMLGIDYYGYGHWYDPTYPHNFDGSAQIANAILTTPNCYTKAKPILTQAGIQVINGSLQSRVTAFNKTTPQNVLANLM